MVYEYSEFCWEGFESAEFVLKYGRHEGVTLASDTRLVAPRCWLVSAGSSAMPF